MCIHMPPYRAGASTCPRPKIGVMHISVRFLQLLVLTMMGNARSLCKENEPTDVQILTLFLMFH